ncbi:MAG: heavy metal translocating P-type ATPase [Actinobacteria bacterium]|nr:heavy metal translocating P-type ATPase [Actinomycetota bacterium]MBO0833966.1 heavy metal translocating P-type ATPase [Actinomycetota bacterium]
MAAGLLAVTVAGLTVGGGLFLAGAHSAAHRAWLATTVCGLGYAFFTVVDSLRRRRAGVDLIALLALAGAVAVGELLAGAVIAVMLASGRALEDWAAGRARRDLSSLLARAPRTARRYGAHGLETVPLSEVQPAERLVVSHGDLVPVDGTVAAGRAVLDESALSGEPVPVERPAGDQVRSGALNLGAPFDLLATERADQSTYAGIIRMVAEAERSQAPFVRLADRYALWFLGVTLAAAGLAWTLAGATRAVAVLVVATPCPLILAAPVALVSGMSVSARLGVVVKGGGVLERLAQCTSVLLDKTGTLTSGHPAVSAVLPAGRYRPDEVLFLAASLDQVSGHVLASAIVSAARGSGRDLSTPQQVQEVAGEGIRGRVAGHLVAVGKARWCGIASPRTTPAWAKTARRRARLDGALTVFVAVDGEPAGVIILDDPVRPDAARMVRALRTGRVRRIVMVTGDRAEVAESVGAIIGVDSVLAERSPADKLDAVRDEARRGPVVMVGDGINDAPALALATVGVAIGARGQSATSEAADATLTVDRIDPLGDVIAVARRTRRIALQSVLAGMGMSVAAMGVAAAGLLPAVWGAVLQEAIDVAVILNALRALRPSAAPVRLAPEDAALTSRFRDEHKIIRADIEALRAAADSLASETANAGLHRARHAYRLLAEEIEPHEQAEERELYPTLDRLFGSPEATATMSRAHAEISRQRRRLGRLLEDIGEGPPDQADMADLRAMLYGLHAVLRLHTAQEDEGYLSLGDHDVAAHPKAPEISLTDARRSG